MSIHNPGSLVIRNLLNVLCTRTLQPERGHGRSSAGPAMVGQHAHLGKLPGQGHRARSEMRGARAGDGYLLFPLRDCRAGSFRPKLRCAEFRKSKQLKDMRAKIMLHTCACMAIASSSFITLVPSCLSVLNLACISVQGVNQ